MVNGFCQGTIGVNVFSMVFFTSEPLLSMVFHISTIGFDGISNGFLPSNHCQRWFFNGHSISCILALDEWDGVNKKALLIKLQLAGPYSKIT